MMPIKQLGQHQWPSGADALIGRLRLTPLGMAARYGVKFSSGTDDLDSYSHVLVKLPSGRVVQFLQYDHYPDQGMLMFADRDDDADQARREAVESLDLELDEVEI